MATIINYYDTVEDGNGWTADPTDIIQSFQHATSYFYISEMNIYMWGLSPYATSGATCSIYLADVAGKPTGDALDTASDISSIISDPRHVNMCFAGSSIIYNPAIRYCFVLHYDTIGGGAPYENDDVEEFYYINDVLQSNILSLRIYGEAGLTPGKPTNPSPIDDATNITLDESPLSWNASDPAADIYEIYFRVQGEDWVKVGDAQAAIEWAVTSELLGYGTIYEWRIDATNVYGITTGDTWTFTSIAFDPPLPTGVTLDAEGEPTGTPTGESGMLTIKRLIAAARNKIYYEDI